MAKRSPILGYNHNVRYRGLIFHVQTEDSGVLSPHLFTHLFHTGVIVSTRKLVYDAGSDEGAIKSLMQAQHKAVMKDLKRGTFDDKIDQYLGGTPGLLPRGFVEPPLHERESQAALARPSDPGIPQPGDEVDRPSEPVIVLEPYEDSEPVRVDNNATIRTPMLDASALQSSPVDMNETLRGTTPSRAASPASDLSNLDLDDDDDLEVAREDSGQPAHTTRDVARWLEPPGDGSATTRRAPPPQQARTRTAERGSSASTIRSSMSPPPPSADLDPPTDVDNGGAVASAIGAGQHNATIRTPMPRDMVPGKVPTITDIIQLELEPDPEPSPTRTRSSRDTDIVLPSDGDTSDGIPGYTTAPAETPRPRAPNESVPPLPPPPSAQSRPNAVGASALPPARPITRPPARPAMTPPQVVSRPITRDNSDRPRDHGDSDAIEVYAPAPPSADTPPGLRAERLGEYSQHKRVSQRMPAVDAPRERSGGVPIPPGLGRPGTRMPTGKNPALPRQPGTPPPLPVARPAPPAQPAPVPQPVRAEPSSGPKGTGGGVPRPRTLTPSRASPPPSRTGSPSSSGHTSGVVMTRPAVIVGAPAKSQPSRVRKAREDEGRGFGQGLISEKSLDEVILAYLSEDADDK